ncbi:eukaryotic peptide chain release factor GTP-binding subunit ERF3A-like [Styela clava]
MNIYCSFSDAIYFGNSVYKLKNLHLNKLPLKKMNGENIPDSWDQEVANNLASLNVNARPFVPNVGAAEFIPSFLKSPQPAVPSAQPTKPMTQQEDLPSQGAVGGEQLAQNIEPSSVGDTPSMNEEASLPEADYVPNAKPAAENWEDTAQNEEVKVEDENEEVELKEEEEDIVEVKKPRPASETEVKKDHLNVVFIGHVDAGKSTIGGQIMYLTGMVDKRTLEKYEREAKEKNRETWYLSWVVDTNQEERDKGKTVEVGRAYFETENKHFTILDAPGHRSFVPNMIGGASQADVAVLVISARRGEFETGFERGGQTREHAMLAKTAGVKYLIVLINKMDDSTVRWSIDRYNECKEGLTPFLKKIGFNPKTVHYMPCSGLTGANLLTSDGNHKEWYNGLPLIPYLDQLPTMHRSGKGPIRLPIVDKYKDMGTIVLGKLESGTLTKGMHVIMQPNKRRVKVLNILSDDVETDEAMAGENCKLRLDNVDDDEVSKGFVLCSPDNLCSTGCLFDAQIAIIEYKSIICAGYSAILHIHTCIEEVEIKLLICLLDRKTGEKVKGRPKFVKQDQTVIARLQTSGAICIESFKNFPQMGRFTLRDEGKTIAIGKVLKVLE